MKNTVSVEIAVGDKQLIIETGALARQADGSVIARVDDTMLFSAVTCADKPQEETDYFPLQVEYREKMYAAGRFPGGFFKRESRPAEKEILTARLTDRPIRPLFPKNYRNEVQINNMLLSADGENDSDILSIIAASAALVISDIPFLGPIAGIRIGRTNGKFIINPTHTQRKTSDLDLIYCCTRDLPLMIEGSAKEISEAGLLAAMKLAQNECIKIVDAQLELRRKLGLPDKITQKPADDITITGATRDIAGKQLTEALLIPDKLEREKRVSGITTMLNEKLLEKFPELTEQQFKLVFDELEIEVVRKNVLEKGKRIDGRSFDEIRPLSAEVGVLPRTHGSALFSRGETQVLGTITLGTKSDVQTLDAVTGGIDEKKFMLHYNFPPYSTGEVGRLGFTGRREIGHGALAERSLQPVVPQDYPYTVRLVSDIMSSNGSSSMASVCAGSLALMDAGIPISKPVAGVSIGLFTGKNKAQIVVDILGAEDHCGDMDFKVAGTRDGITGFQLDLKTNGLQWKLVETAFEKARIARHQILDYMNSVISSPRPDLSSYAPRIQQIKIDPENIGALIGPGGKNIRRITELSGAQVDIDDDGTVSVFSTSKESMEIAVREINLITAEPEIGTIYNGTVTGIKDFGVFVEILPGTDGLVHISELADFRVNNISDICKLGDQMWVKCIGIDDRGKIKLSRKQAMQEKDS